MLEVLGKWKLVCAATNTDLRDTSKIAKISFSAAIKTDSGTLSVMGAQQNSETEM